MATPGQHYLAAALSASEAPCVSIYQPTHRHHPHNAQDPIRFKNLVTTIEASLAKEYPTRDVRSLIEPLQQLQKDDAFWNHTADGLAVLASPARFDVFKLPRAVPERAIVANSFHLKPLLRYSQSADRFHLLAISRENIALFEGNRYALDPMPLPKFPEYPRPAAQHDPRIETLNRAATEEYFRGIDRAVMEEVSKSASVPLVLAGMAENLTTFRAVTKNPHVVADGVTGDPFAHTADELRGRAWAVLEPHYLARLAKFTDAFGTAASREQGTGDLSDAARAAIAGRIGTLLIDADIVQPGKIDPTTGAIQSADLANPNVDDKLDDLAELVLKHGGDVVVVPSERMPTKTGLAAIYRF